MAQYRGTVEGTRGAASRLGSKAVNVSFDFAGKDIVDSRDIVEQLRALERATDEAPEPDEDGTYDGLDLDDLAMLRALRDLDEEV